MKRVLFLVILLLFTVNLHSMEQFDFRGLWKVENYSAIQIIQLYTDGFDYFTNGYRIRQEYLEDPLRYIELDFIDEDLLYITRANGTRLRGFYQIKENSGTNSVDFPYYIFLEDKYTNSYYIPFRTTSENNYEINYNLELNLRDQLIQITCLARISMDSDELNN